MTKAYDNVIERSVFLHPVHYGIMYGSNNVIAIKSGSGGSIEGYNGKYLEIASVLREKYGCTIICASNPKTVFGVYTASAKQYITLIKNVCMLKRIGNPKIYAVGVSRGGAMFLTQHYKYPEIKNVLSINAPDNFSPLSVISSCSRSDADVQFVYGSKDPSAKHRRLLPKNANVRIIEGQNHQFSVEGRETVKDVILEWVSSIPEIIQKK